MQVSVIVPTRNRPEKLAQLLDCLSTQTIDRAHYQIVVVDDGSSPPVAFSNMQCPSSIIVRLDGKERSAARNQGAAAASCDLLVFLDDDMSLDRDFLASHLAAHQEWPNALMVGAV